MLNKFGLAANTNNENTAKAVGKSTVPALKRRALGDITNSYADEGPREAISKRPQVSLSSVVPAPVQQDTAMVVSEPTNASERIYMQRSYDDIDSRDNDNPLLATEYINEMYENFNELEQEFRVNPNYMSRQEFINDKMRTILVDWLVSCYR